jgi:hypothetical protein
MCNDLSPVLLKKETWAFKEKKRKNIYCLEGPSIGKNLDT